MIDGNRKDFTHDLKRIIQSEKQKLQRDKESFANDQISHRDNNYTSHEQYKTDMTQDFDTNGGIKFGQYEERQRQLRQERALEYKKFLAEKEYRSKGVVSPVLQNDSNNNLKNNQEEKMFHSRGAPSRKELTTPDLYEELLRRKRAEEKRYRDSYDDPEMYSARQGQSKEEGSRSKKEVSFDVEDDELFEWAKRKAKGKRGNSAVNNREIKAQQSSDVDNRAKSVPPEPSGFIFGGRDSAKVKQQKQAEYKKQLEEQIKEREEEKKRQRLKKMGKITSSTDLTKEVAVDKSPVTEEDDQSRTRVPEKNSRSRWKDHDDDDDDFFEKRRRRPNWDHPGYDPYMAMMYGPYPGPPQYNYDRFRGDPYGNFPPMPAGYRGGFGADAYRERGYGFENRERRFDSDDFGGASREKSRKEAKKGRRMEFPDEEDQGHVQKGSQQEQPSKEKNPPGGFASTSIFGENVANSNKDDSRAKQLAYQEELKRQIEEKSEAKRKEKEAQERYDAKIEAQILEYNPWGKGGGGAPIKNEQGNIVTDLRTMRQFNQEGKGISPPSKSPRLQLEGLTADQQPSPMLAALEKINMEDSSPRIALDASMNKSSPYARGAALRELQGLNQDGGQKSAQEEYREYLRLQVEEKNRRKREEEEKLREEEMRENRRLEEQRKKIEQEFLEEQENQRKKEEEVRKKNDELRKAAEEKRLEAERKRREAEEERHQTLLRRSLEQKSLQEALQRARAESPPIPTVQKQGRTESPPVPAIRKVQEHREPSPPVPAEVTAVQRETNKRSSSPPVPAVIKQQTAAKTVTTEETRERQHEIQLRSESRLLTEAAQNNVQFPHQSPRTEHQTTENSDMAYLSSIRDKIYDVTEVAKRTENVVEQKHVLTQLTAIRKQLLNEEKKLEESIEVSKEKYREMKTKGVARQDSGTGAEIFEKARMKRNSVARKQENRAAEDFKRITAKSSLLDLKGNRDSSSDLDHKQQEFIRKQEEKLTALRQLLENSAKNLQLEALKMNERPGSRTSLLESDSKFIGVDYSQSSRPQSRQRKNILQRKGSKQDRQSELRKDSLLPSSSKPQTPPARSQTPGNMSVQSATTLAIEEIAARNEERLRQLKMHEQHSRQTEEPTAENAEEVINAFLNKKL